MERAGIDLKKQTPISEGSARGMMCLQGDKELIAVGKNIIVRVESMGGVTEGGLHLPPGTESQRVFVKSIGGDVKVDNADGKKLEVGDEILAVGLALIPLYDPIKNEIKNVKMIGENDVIAIIGD
jgi:co-chaperonin GroES (HSP10)